MIKVIWTRAWNNSSFSTIRCPITTGGHVLRVHSTTNRKIILWTTQTL